MSAISQIIDGMSLPKMATVKQNFSAVNLENPLQALFVQLEQLSITPGMTIAVTAGSRGICQIDQITRTVVDFLKLRGAKPFIVTAMGSHGGATCQGQLDVLSGLGITEDTMGVPVKPGVEVTQIGALEDGTPVFMDSVALSAQGIVLINRIKPHTGFHGKYESGLMKMMAVGLGNQCGANYIHSNGVNEISGKIEHIGCHVLKHTNILFGVAILENAQERIGEIHVLRQEEIPLREPELLNKSRTMMPSILFKNLDLLVVDRIGKNISGGGMDCNVTGGFSMPGGVASPRPTFITVLDLTQETHGSAFGVGAADTITRRLFDKIDMATTYPNCLTTGTPELVKIPMILDNQKLAIQAAIKMMLGVDRSRLRMIRIQDTLHVDTIQISEELLPEAFADAHITVISEPTELVFNDDGNLF